jgi:RNA polymerase sigma-70 factor (ECF subfamily)
MSCHDHHDHHHDQPGAADERLLTPEVVRTLVDNHARSLAFLERRVGRRDVAEEILQEAFVRGIDKSASLQHEESATAWFYRLLRNAIVDHYRRRDAERRALEGVAREADEAVEPDAELMDTVCRCVGTLVDTLKPEYAEAVRRVDVEGQSVKDFAGAAGITANNAAVRLHRAREALRRQVAVSCGTCATHGCLDCHCGARDSRV